MMLPLRRLDTGLRRLAGGGVLALAACGVLIVGAADYLTGYEVSMSVFYLGPVAVAAWYAGRGPGVAVAVLSCLSWYLADVAGGHPYSHPAIPFWNALVRLGFFAITAWLLATLRKGLLRQEHLARTDGLTGLYGRRAFDDRLEHDLALAQRRKTALTLAYLDVDDFKAVNEAHGHAGGDRVLLEIGRILKRSIREADTAARIGGDEFALVLPDTDGRGAQELVAKLGRGLREAQAMSDWGITCSIGVATFVGPVPSRESALTAADELMYQVKRERKGAVAFRVLGEAPAPRAAA